MMSELIFKILFSCFLNCYNRFNISFLFTSIDKDNCASSTEIIPHLLGFGWALALANLNERD